MSSQKSGRIPVFTQYGRVEMADAERVRELQRAANSVFVRRHSDGALLRIMLYSHGDDYAVRPHRGNPQTDIHNAETDNNPRGVYTFKRTCGSAAAGPHS